MFSRVATSIVAIAALIAATISPAGVCALMCETHSRTRVHQHCGEDLDQMPGMTHNHSAMHHSDLADETLVVAAQSCGLDCAVAERLISARKVVPQLTVVQTGAVALEASSRLLGRHVEGAWSLDSGPPFVPSLHTASYSILRI